VHFDFTCNYVARPNVALNEAEHLHELTLAESTYSSNIKILAQETGVVSCLSFIRGTVVQSWSVGSTQLVHCLESRSVHSWEVKLNISSVVISIGATASVRYREVVRSWEGPLWEVPLYYECHYYIATIGRRKSCT